MRWQVWTRPGRASALARALRRCGTARPLRSVSYSVMSNGVQVFVSAMTSLLVGAAAVGASIYVASINGAYSYGAAQSSTANNVRAVARVVGADVRAQTLAFAARHDLEVATGVRDDDMSRYDVGDCRKAKPAVPRNCYVPPLSPDIQAAAKLAPINVTNSDLRTLATGLRASDWSLLRNNERFFNAIVSDRHLRSHTQPSVLLDALENMDAALTEAAYESDP